MKKKIIIFMIVVLVVIIGIICFIKINNKIVASVSIDINPSFEIKLTNNEKVKKIISLNDDARDVITNDLVGRKLDDTLKKVVVNLINKGYIDDNHVVILLYSKGNIKSSDIENKLRDVFDDKQIATDIIVVKNITKEDEEIAKKYNISLAKASYINNISKENKNIKMDYLIDKSVNELRDTKDRGLYCESGYILEGDFCLKEVERKTAASGMVCPHGYYEYNDKCYEEVPYEEGDKLVCRDDFTLNKTKCSRTFTMDAEASKYSCEKGEAKTRREMNLTGSDAGDANDIVCVDLSSATHPVSPCEANDGTEFTISGGKCYWHRAPVIETGCPGKIQVAGECWDDASNIYICPGYRDGKQYSSRNEYCEHSIKYINPIVSEYKCPQDFTLKGNKCEKEEIEDAIHERFCPSGYSKVDNDRCINYNKISDKENGYVCDYENSRLKGNSCVIYEFKEAKK